MRLKIYENEGFTTFELMISAVIFIAITSIALITFKGGTGRQDLMPARDIFINDLRNLRSYSLAGRQQGAAVPDGGYGLVINKCLSAPCGYTMFADLNGDGTYDSGEEITNGIKNFSNNIIVYELNSFNGVLWRQDPGPVTIIFRPYNAKIYMSGMLATVVNENININYVNVNGNYNVNYNYNYSGSTNNANIAGEFDLVLQEQIVFKDVKTNKTVLIKINGGSGTIIEGD